MTTMDAMIAYFIRLETQRLVSLRRVLTSEHLLRNNANLRASKLQFTGLLVYHGEVNALFVPVCLEITDSVDWAQKTNLRRNTESSGKSLRSFRLLSALGPKFVKAASRFLSSASRHAKS